MGESLYDPFLGTFYIRGPRLFLPLKVSAPLKCPLKCLIKWLSRKKSIMSRSFLNSGTLIVIMTAFLPIDIVIICENSYDSLFWEEKKLKIVNKVILIWFDMIFCRLREKCGRLSRIIPQSPHGLNTWKSALLLYLPNHLCVWIMSLTGLNTYKSLWTI